MDIKTMASTAKLFMKHNSTVILTGVAVAGVVTTSVLAARAYGKTVEDMNPREEWSAKDRLSYAWANNKKYYIPPVLVGCATIGCIVAANRVDARQKAALASAWGIATESARQLEEKFVSEIGDEKVKKIKEAVDADLIRDNPPNESNTTIVNENGVLIFDSWTGRYFLGNIEAVKASVNDLAHRLIYGTDAFITLNEFYTEVGLETVAAGDELGWSAEDPIDVDWSAHVATDGRPAAVIRFTTFPTPWENYGGWRR